MDEKSKKFNINYEDGYWLFEAIKKLFHSIDKDKIMDKIKKLKRRFPLKTKKELAEKLILEASGWSSLSGGTCSIPACFPGLGTLIEVGSAGADSINWLRIQSILIIEVSMLYGYSGHSEKRMMEILIILSEAAGFNDYAKELAKQLKSSDLNSSSIISSARKISWHIGVYLLKRNILRFIPVVGVIYSARRNYISTGAVGENAIIYYERKHLSS